MTPFTLSGALAAVSTLIFGFFVFSKDPKKKLYQLWLYFNLAICMWGLGGMAVGLSRTPEQADIAWRLTYAFGVIWIPVFFLHLVYEFCDLKGTKLVTAVYVINVLFVPIIFTKYIGSSMRLVFDSIYYLVPSNPFYTFLVVVWLSSFVYAFAVLVKTNFTTTNLHKKQQIKYIILAVSIGAIGGTSNFLPFFGIDVYPWGNFAIPIYPALMAYAIVKYELLDIRVVIKKTATHLFWVLLISVPYIALVLFTHGLASGDLHFRHQLNFFSLTSLICFVLTLSLAIFSFIQGKSKIQKLFGWFNLAVAIWAFGSFLAGTSMDADSAVSAWTFAFIGGFLISPIFYHLTISICGISRRFWLFIAYGQAFVFVGLTLVDPTFLYTGTGTVFDFIALRASPILIGSVAIFYFLVTVSFGELIAKYKNSDKAKKGKFNYLIVGFLFGFLGSVLIMPAMLGFELIYPFGHIGICLYTLILAYAIFKHNLLDIRIAIKKTAVYTGILSVASLLYFGIIYLLHIALFSNSNANNLFLENFLSILIIAIIFKPVEIFFNRTIERKFFRGTIGQIAEQKAQLETELERRERLKSVGILAAGMAHEIKNPITAINTFAEYLPIKYDDPEFRAKFSRIVMGETARIKNIVSDLLAFSKPQEPKKELCSLEHILKDTAELLTSALMNHGISVRMEFGKAGHALVDPNQTKQAFLNIILNSIDAMKESGGELLLTTHKDESVLTVIIQDSGCGIPRDRIAHIFDPFYTSKDHGTGLGLAITHSLILQNNGSIEVESRESQGTRFIIKFPTH